jgi:hypothetical protein
MVLLDGCFECFQRRCKLSVPDGNSSRQIWMLIGVDSAVIRQEFQTVAVPCSCYSCRGWHISGHTDIATSWWTTLYMRVTSAMNLLCSRVFQLRFWTIDVTLSGFSGLYGWFLTNLAAFRCICSTCFI